MSNLRHLRILSNEMKTNQKRKKLTKSSIHSITFLSATSTTDYWTHLFRGHISTQTRFGVSTNLENCLVGGGIDMRFPCIRTLEPLAAPMTKKLWPPAKGLWRDIIYHKNNLPWLYWASIAYLDNWIDKFTNTWIAIYF